MPLRVVRLGEILPRLSKNRPNWVCSRLHRAALFSRKVPVLLIRPWINSLELQDPRTTNRRCSIRTKRTPFTRLCRKKLNFFFVARMGQLRMTELQTNALSNLHKEIFRMRFTQIAKITFRMSQKCLIWANARSYLSCPSKNLRKQSAKLTIRRRLSVWMKTSKKTNKWTFKWRPNCTSSHRNPPQ